MSEPVPAAEIERIVGTKRHRQCHFGRAVTAEQKVYILHSQRCLDTGIDLRDCRASIALDQGIDQSWWEGWEDRPVLLAVWDGRLIPLFEVDEEGVRVR